MKTITSGQVDTCPEQTSKQRTQTGNSAAPHAVVTSNGTESANQCAGDTQPVLVEAGSGQPAWDLYTIKVTWQEDVRSELLESTLGDFLDHIEQGTYAKRVRLIRERYNRVLQETGDPKKAKDAVADLKKGLPGITPSGLFEGRRKGDSLAQYTKEICYDIDHCDPFPILAALPKCPHVQVAFVSPTETGVKLFVPVDAAEDGSNHLDLWQAGKRMMKHYFNADVDESRKDITGLCFASAGPVYRNLHAKPVTLAEFPPEPEPEPEAPKGAKQSQRHKPGMAEGKAKARPAEAEAGGKALFKLDASLVPEDGVEARKVVTALQYIDPSPENVWREVGMALKAQWGDAAWDLFDEWSRNGSGYDEAENRTRWDSFHDDPNAGITLGTIFHYAKENGWRHYDKAGIFLPTRSNSDFCQNVYKIIAPKHTVFLQGGETVCIETINGEPAIVTADAHKGIRLFEAHIQFLNTRETKNGEEIIIPVALSEHHAKLLVRGVRPGELPELRGITACPPLVERTLNTGEQELPVAGPGYIPETGWFNASQAEIKIPSPDEAIEKYKWLHREFDFPTPGDRSRALVYPIGVALKLSGLIKGFVPMDFGTANGQQSGKGTRQRMTAAFFNRRMEIITQSDHHIGGTSEMFKSACLAGRPFIQLDNFDHFECREMEAFLTGENVRMRDAFGRARSIDPANHFVFLSSNGLAARRDLALRAWFIRILKKPDDYQFHQYREGGIVEHILVHQAEYLGCIYAIVAEWWKQYCLRTDETRHAFVDFTQACDWIGQHILAEAPVMEGHPEAQQQYSDAGKVIFLRLWDVLAKQGKLDRFFRAGQLATTAFRYSVPIPGLRPQLQGDENAGAKLIGSLAADVFDDAEVLDLGQGKIVERKSAHPAEDCDELSLPHGGKSSPCYVFKQDARQAGARTSSQAASAGGGSPQEREPDAGPEVQDRITAFRDNLLTALAKAGKTAPCRVSTQEIAKLFKADSENSAGKWMAKIAARYPARFVKADTKHERGWQILS